MKRMQRIWSILLVLTMVLCLRLTVYAADDIVLTMTSSAPVTEVGETFSVTIRADQDFAARGCGITISYDPAVVEPELAASTSAVPFAIHGPMELDGRTVLRISFLPGSQTLNFTAADALAVVQFKALSVTEQSEIIMDAAYFYDASLAELSLTKAEPVRLAVEPGTVYIPVTGITLDQSDISLEEGEMAALKATIAPLGASDPTVSWSSSDESVAIVSGGSVKALSAGTATITATTNDGGFTASCTVTVILPKVGYTVKMPADTTANIGDVIRIPVIISNEDGKTGFNAFDLSFTYDPSVLELVTDSLSGLTVDVTYGQINILGYGEDRSVGSVPFVLEFKALKNQSTEILLTTARVDNSGNAVVKNAPPAILLDDRTAITVAGFPVTLPEGFTGEETAKPGVEYTFNEPADSYDYTVSATVNGAEVPVVDHGDGSYSIPGEYVTGEIVITATRTGKIFRVTLGTDMTGETTAQYGNDYTATIVRDEKFRYSVTVSVGGKAYTGYTVTDDTYTIPGEDIVGDIVFSVEKTEITKPVDPDTMHKVTFTGSGAGAAQGNAATVRHGSSYTLTLKTELGYVYQVSYKMGGKPCGTVEPNEDGAYVIESVTAPLEILITKTLDLQLSVHEYVTLDQKTVFLVLVQTELGAGKVFTYSGNAMYYSNAYNAWAYLVITSDSLNADTARGRIGVGNGKAQVLVKPDGDVNATGLVDINDAQLVYDLYNGKYENFVRISMVKFLNADVNLDKKVSVMDAAAVVGKIE